MAYYIHNNSRHYYFDQGKGDTVLLLHGITNSGRAFAPQIPVLLEAGYRIIVPDHAGHGASENVEHPYSIAELAADTMALIKKLSLKQINIVGVSLGGMVALQLVADNPALFKRLVVGNSFTETVSSAFSDMATSWAKVFMSEDGPLKRFEKTWPILASESFRSSQAGLITYQNWQAQAAMSDGKSLANIALGIVGFDIRERLADIQQPALVMSAEHDVISPVMNSQTLAELIPNAQHVTIAGAAHLPNVDSSVQFNDCLLSFLTDTNRKR